MQFTIKIVTNVRFDKMYYRFRANEETREVHIRTGTDQEEIIGVKREWVHPWRKTNKNNAAYYDVVVQELGKNFQIH